MTPPDGSDDTRYTPANRVDRVFDLLTDLRIELGKQQERLGVVDSLVSSFRIRCEKFTNNIYILAGNQKVAEHQLTELQKKVDALSKNVESVQACINDLLAFKNASVDCHADLEESIARLAITQTDLATKTVENNHCGDIRDLEVGTLVTQVAKLVTSMESLSDEVDTLKSINDKKKSTLEFIIWLGVAIGGTATLAATLYSAGFFGWLRSLFK